MAKPSAGKHSSMNIKFILVLIRLSIYFSSFLFSSFLVSSVPSFLLPLSFKSWLLLLAHFGNYYAYYKGCFLTISTVWDNGHFILGEEGNGQLWWSAHPQFPDRRESLPSSPGFWCCWTGEFLIISWKVRVMLLLLGSSWALSVQRDCSLQFLCAFSLMWGVWACRRTSLPWLLVAVLSSLLQKERPTPQGETEKPGSLLSVSQPLSSNWNTFYKWCKLYSGRFLLMVASLTRLQHRAGTWAWWTLKMLAHTWRKISQTVYIKKKLLAGIVSRLGSGVLVLTMTLHYHLTMFPEVSFKINT